MDHTTGAPDFEHAGRGNFITALTAAAAVWLQKARACGSHCDPRPGIAPLRGRGTSFGITRCFQVLSPEGSYDTRNRGHHGNETARSDRRNSDRSASGRTGSVGACSPRDFNGPDGLDSWRSLVCVLPYLSRIIAGGAMFHDAMPTQEPWIAPARQTPITSVVCVGRLRPARILNEPLKRPRRRPARSASGGAEFVVMKKK
jgi:hypothetical protein